MMDIIATNGLARLTFLVLLFALVVMSAVFVAGLASRRATLKADLRDIAGPAASLGRPRLEDRKHSAWAKLAERIEEVGLNLTDTNADRLRSKLVAAGYDSPAAPKIFTLTRLALIFILPGAYVLLASLGNQRLSLLKLYAIGSVLALAGLYLPNLFITAKADRRREAITNGFPDCLDLLLVCVEAGLGLEAALDRVGREMSTSHPLVAQLLLTATMQLRAGAAREAALRTMGDSSGVDEIRSFSTLLIQSDKLGTSMSDTLRVYAAEMREKRRMRAEEKAHRLPVLISIPLVVCMLPTMIGVLMLPGVVRVVRQLLPALSGGG
jgi:tight adherence protein C